jgi:SSS family solute:Na+ symporter
LIIPVIVVLPGIVAYVMNIGPDGLVTAQSADPSFIGEGGKIINDNAAPWLIKTFIPTGLKGLVLAALSAAIVSSLASILNSTATIFTMDIYKPYINKKASEGKLVNVGRLTAAAGLVIAVLIAPQLKNLGQVFQYIQEYTGVVSPGILAVFMLGLFSRKTTNKAAIFGVVLSIPIALYFKVAPHGWSDSVLFLNLPFLDQMFWTWILSMIIILGVSYIEAKGKDNEKGILLSKELFKTEKAFNISAVIIILILIVLYTVFW